MPSVIKPFSIKNVFGISVAIIAWFSLGFQFYVTDITITYYLSYFTTLCNLLIALCLTFSILFPNTRPGVFFSSLSVQSAIALYIFIVSLVYNLVLRGIWVLTGWQYILDNMVHVVIPILYIFYWLFFRTKGVLQWKAGFLWVIFPFMYLVYSLVRGSMIKWYPYPFLDAAKFGYAKVFLNIGVMLIVFLVAGFILISITRSLKKVKPEVL